MENGIVKWFDEKKGYGFIENTNGSSDVFVHYSSIESNGYKTLSEGDRVTFDIENTQKGLTARNVCIV